VSVRNSRPIGYVDDSSIHTRRLLPSLQIVHNTLAVVSSSAGQIQVSYRPNNCIFNLQPMEIKQSLTNVCHLFFLNSLSKIIYFIEKI
jgi:hypothetical protein